MENQHQTKVKATFSVKFRVVEGDENVVEWKDNTVFISKENFKTLN